VRLGVAVVKRWVLFFRTVIVVLSFKTKI